MSDSGIMRVGRFSLLLAVALHLPLLSMPAGAQECAMEPEPPIVDVPVQVAGQTPCNQMMAIPVQAVPVQAQPGRPVQGQPQAQHPQAQQQVQQAAQTQRPQQQPQRQQPQAQQRQVAQQNVQRQVTQQQPSQRQMVVVPERHYVNPICLAPGQIAPGAPIPGVTRYRPATVSSSANSAPRQPKPKAKETRVMSYSFTPGEVVYNTNAKPYPTATERIRVR